MTREWAALAVASVLGLAPWMLAAESDQGQPAAAQPGPAQAGPAQPGAAQPGPSQPFRVETNFVRVDAYPTSDGRPVLDLTANDFEVLEDGVPQRIETFEHVQINQLISTSDRRDPSTVAEARTAATNPRARVFVIFLDGYQTPLEGSYRIQHVLATMLDRLIGPDDLFAVMTPRMSASEIVFARRTETIEGELQRYWYWGRGDALVQQDPEDQLISCATATSLPGSRNDPGVDANSAHRTPARKAGDGRADRPVEISPRRARRAQGRDCRDQRLAALSAGQQFAEGPGCHRRFGSPARSVLVPMDG